MKVHLEDGTTREMVFGASLIGMTVKSIELEKRDVYSMQAGLTSDSLITRELTTTYLANLTKRFRPLGATND